MRAPAGRGLVRTLAAAFVRAHFYPSNAGQPVRRDPTYGRIDRDLQWRIQELYPHASLGERVVLELKLQASRDRAAAST